MKVIVVSSLLVLILASLACGYHYIFTEEDKNDCENAAKKVTLEYRGTTWIMNSCVLKITSQEGLMRTKEFVLDMMIPDAEPGFVIMVCPKVVVTKDVEGNLTFDKEFSSCFYNKNNEYSDYLVTPR